MKTLIKKTSFALIAISLISFPLFSPLQIASETNDVEALAQREEERENDFLSQLALEIPTLTDNPSQTITFTDPSPDGSGVEIRIDNGEFQQISSPYNLPALSIGQHQIEFRFVDRFDSTQTLERSIIIIPRPPIISSPIFEEDFLEIGGTGLADSELILILSSERNILVEETRIDREGEWEIQIATEDLSEGIFTFTAYTRRNGYASNLADSITFELGESDRVIVDNGREIYFSFNELSLDNIGQIISKNIDLVLLVGASFIVGFFIALIISSMARGGAEKRKLREFEKKIKENNKTEKKEMTLRERLSQSNTNNKKEEEEENKQEEDLKVDKKSKKDKEKKKKGKKVKKKTPKKKKESTKEEKKESKNKTEKILQKVDFLKDYKRLDPDDDKGEEKDNIVVKVTSKS